MKPPTEKQEWYFPVLVATLLIVVVGCIYFYVDNVDRAKVVETAEREILDQLSTTSTILSRAINSAERQTRFLNGTPPISGIVRSSRNGGIDPLDQTPYPVWVSRLQKIAVSYMENNPDVLQVRLIGVADKGKELVRVSRERGNIHVVDNVNLQSKAQEPYFQDASQLNEGEVHISAINLNREYERIVYPLLPTYRVSVPVFNELGGLFGLVVVNFDGNQLLDMVRENTNSNLEFYLLSHQKEFILHPDTIREFAAELGRQDLAPAEDFLLASNPGSKAVRLVDLEGGPMYVSNRQVWLSRPDEGRYLDLVAAVRKTRIDGSVYQHLAITMVSVLLVVAIAVVTVLFYQRQLTRRYAYSVAEAKFKAIVTGSQDAIISVDKANRVKSWNRAAIKLLGSSEQDAVGEPLLSLLRLEEPSRLSTNLLDEVHELGISKSIDVGLWSNNHLIELSLSLSPIESRGTIEGATLILRDISKERQAAHEVHRLNASLESQVEERTQDLEVARNQALQASELKSAFLANMSHEIRTPMNGIFGMLNLLKRSSLDDQQTRYLSMAENSVESLSSLINDILDLSKVEAGKLELESVEFDLLDVMSSQISSLSLRAQQRGLEVLFDFAGVEQSSVMGDPHRFKQILTNLMGNAIKFTQRGEIVVSARTFLTSDGSVSVSYSVTDTGIGIPPSRVGNLFEAFSQADSSTTRRFGGTGLGLSITRHLVDQMGGEITVESEEGKGTIFTVNLNLKPGSNQPVLEQHKFLIKGKQVLVLAKNLNLMAGTRKLLRSWKAHVDTTNSLDEVIARLETKNIDVLIIDQEAFRLIQNQKLMNIIWRPETLSWLKVAVLAPQSPNFDDLELDGLDSRAVMKLIKPVSPMEYGKMLERFYGNGAVDSESGLQEREMLEQNLDQQLARFIGTRLLVVDDVMINREVIVGLMQSFDFSILEAANGMEALKVLGSEPIDLVLMDCQMPEMDGFIATSKVREGAAGKHNQQVPILAMTAGAMAGDRDACIAAGMNDYLTKPIVSLEFKQKLLNWLQSSKSQASVTSPPEVIRLDEIDSVPDLNFDAAIARMGNNPRIFKKMVDLYIEDTPSKLRSLSDSLEKEQLETARHLGHALKGTSATIGAEKMQRLCQQIEIAADQENVEMVRQAITKLNHVYPEVLQSLSKQDLG